ncbi:DNA topoisomerase (ATP-hydrolyzing) subunit B [Thermodesulfobacterium hveragerdense]|uniref:DNA topoisomerase (ATP-hydrolyzing) subunit B n=1 Tax=Thermodesulfobacterium hveragerdense TaxID=53424 RepID=UPI0003F7FF1B|nr:DNA topoisomerase (ATP-hydrolyzing) subunit B [Thermodesulfobacterium hveragerdense]
METERNMQYEAQSIKVLSGLEGVRTRPAMYIGSTDVSGFHHLLWEVLDNAIDEALAGFATEIWIRIHPDGSASVEDNGRGIPVDLHPEEKVPGLELVMTRLHAGAKFDHGVYKVSGGLHGVGVSVVNALSEWLIAEVYRDGKTYKQTYKRGIPDGPVEIVGETKKRGTLVRFKPDREIFGDLEFDLDIIKRRVKELAYLNPAIKLHLIDERIGYTEKFHYKGGIVELVKGLNAKKNPVHSKVIYIEGEKENIKVEIALQYNSGYTETIYSYVNNIFTKEGGTHVIGFRAALTKAINRYISDDKVPKQFKIKIEGEDVKEGLCGVISLKVPDPQFEGQTKMKLGNSEVKPIVESIVYEGLLKFFEENPGEAKKIIQKLVIAAKAREASRKAKELVRKKSEIEDFIVAGKLADCSEKAPEKRELFIVEGDSAGGSAKQARDRRFQAILPLKGKILNVEKANIEKMLSSEEIKGLIAALGTGIGPESFNPDKCKYHKIIIMTDADVDGAHIRTLLLTFFYRQMFELIERGWIFIAQPPLYRVVDGKKEVYLKNDEELDKYIINKLAENVKISFTKDQQTFLLKDFKSFFLNCAKLDRLLLNLLKKTYPPQVVLILLQGGFDNLTYFEDLNKIEQIAIDCQKAGFKVSKTKSSSYNPKYYEFFVFSEKEATVSCLVGPELILERDYREALKVFSHLKPNLGQTIHIEYKGEKKSWDNWFFSISEILSYLREEGRKGLFVQRYKGLGEMNSKQLWETTMDPQKRVLKQVTIKDAEKADELFSILMGENVEPRREFIYKHALEYRELDI